MLHAAAEGAAAQIAAAKMEAASHLAAAAAAEASLQEAQLVLADALEARDAMRRELQSAQAEAAARFEEDCAAMRTQARLLRRLSPWKAGPGLGAVLRFSDCWSFYRAVLLVCMLRPTRGMRAPVLLLARAQDRGVLSCLTPFLAQLGAVVAPPGQLREAERRSRRGGAARPRRGRGGSLGARRRAEGCGGGQGAGERSSANFAPAQALMILSTSPHSHDAHQAVLLKLRGTVSQPYLRLTRLSASQRL